MAINAWKKARWPGANPNAHMKPSPSKEAGAKSAFDDKHGMEYKPVKQDPEWKGSGKQIDWKK